MKLDRRGLLGVGVAGLAMAGLARHAAAQSFPSRQIRWVIPFAPGGNYDVTARIVSDPMGRTSRPSILIDNKPGAGGVVGLEAALNTPPDGYTISMASFTVAYVAPLFAGKQPLLPQMAPVSILTTVPTSLVTRADSRFRDMRVRWRRSAPSPAPSRSVMPATAPPTMSASCACS